MLAAADQLRAQTVGDVVTYVINRNINFTNVCVKQCGFCAFSRGHLAEEGYFLPIEEIIRRAPEARDLGASEVCVQAGLAPGMDGWHYVKLCRAVKEALPELHIHGFSPEEVLYGSTLTGVSIRDYLLALKDAGVGSLPGTSAEVFVDEVRQHISPGRISHRHSGSRSSKPLMKSASRPPRRSCTAISRRARHRAIHLSILRDIQKRTGGITEFVPLSFVYEEAPMFHRKALRRAAPRRQRRGSDEDVRGVAPDAEQLDSQPAGFLGEGRAEAVADRAARRRQRFRRHADQRKHFHRRRRRLTASS